MSICTVFVKHFSAFLSIQYTRASFYSSAPWHTLSAMLQCSGLLKHLIGGSLVPLVSPDATKRPLFASLFASHNLPFRQGARAEKRPASTLVWSSVTTTWPVCPNQLRISWNSFCFRNIPPRSIINRFRGNPLIFCCVRRYITTSALFRSRRSPQASVPPHIIGACKLMHLADVANDITANNKLTRARRFANRLIIH